LGLLTGAGLSWRGRLDLLRFQAWVGRRSRAFDPDRPEHTPVGDLTVAAVAERYSAELRDYTFEPLAGGFFGWQLDRSAAAPLICLLLATRSTTNWHTYRHGMDDLARRLAERVDVTTGCRVHEVVSAHEAARIVTDNGVLTARRAVLCVPAPVALGLHANVAEDERPYLQASTYAPMLRVSCLLDQPLSARGGGRAYIIALPAAENRVLSGLTLDHTKPARAPAGRGLVSLLTRPHATRELIDASDDEIVHRLTEEGERYLPGLRRAIRASVVSRFGHGLPEATPAALRLRSGFLQRPTRTVEYAGDWLACRPNCEGAVRSAALACRRVLDGTSRAPRRFPATTRR
jgi:oxygen-dependent protoporphyrinogen oxidase